MRINKFNANANAMVGVNGNKNFKSVKHRTIAAYTLHTHTFAHAHRTCVSSVWCCYFTRSLFLKQTVTVL